MRSILKTMITLVLGAGVYGFAQAAASDRPDYCAIDHDHRSHNSSYYDYYDADKYYRAGSYRGGSNDRYDRRGSRDRYDRGGRYDDGYGRGGRYGQRWARSRVVHRETFRTQYRARIVLVEEIYWTRSGREQLVCSIVAKGREAHYVPQRRLRRIANRGCSSRARVQYLERSRGYDRRY